MEYVTACARQRGEREASLLLQQYLCRRVPACFACLCNVDLSADSGGESGLRTEGGKKEEKTEKQAGRYVTGQLRLWCRGFPWQKAARRPGKWLKRAERELESLMSRSIEAVRDSFPGQEASVLWGILLSVGEEVLIMGSGQEFSLLRMSLGKGTVTGLGGNLRGRLEPGAGILLATEGLSGEALFLSGVQAEEQAGRCLRELIKQAGETDGGMAAVLLVTKEDGNE